MTENFDNRKAKEPRRCEAFHSRFAPIASLRQNVFELVRDGIAGENGRASARDDEEIHPPRQSAATAAKKFTHLPFDSIAHDRIAHLAADGDPKPGLILFIGLANDYEICGLILTADARQVQEFRSFSQAGRFRKAFRPLQRHPLQLDYLRARLGGTLTVSFLRPLARRRLSTLRPPGVCIRARKPCVRFLRMLLG